jgi:DNA ligase-1
MTNTLFKFELPTLYARGKTGAVLTWDIEVEGNKYRMITGQENGAKSTSKWTIATAKSEDTDEQQAAAEATAKWKKKIKTHGYHEDVKDIDKAMSYVEPMLAHPLIAYRTDQKTGKIEKIDRTPYVKLPIMCDRKYNGFRQVTTVMGPKTRKGEPVKSAPHIFTALEPMFTKIPDLVMDGELYNHDLRHNLNELSKIASTKADHKITPEFLARSERIIRYYVYDGYGFSCPENISVKLSDGTQMGMLKDTPVVEATPCILRREALKILLKGIPYIVVVPYEMHPTIESAKVFFGEVVDDGYEGLILRRYDAPYQHDRTNDLIKLKPFDDMEVVILEVIDPGSGNWGGTGKTAMVRMANGKEFKATFKGGREQATKILLEKDKWEGQEVTITYCGFTGLGTPNHAQIDPNNCFKGDR